jgi:hypothetical protein
VGDFEVATGGGLWVAAGAIVGWSCAATYSLINGNFGWWTDKVDVPFLKFYGADMLNGPILMPLSFALVMKFYRKIPETFSRLYSEKILLPEGVAYLNERINSPRVHTYYRSVKLSLLGLMGLLSIVCMQLWVTDDLSGWADPQRSFSWPSMVLVIVPIAMFLMFHLGFVIDQICLAMLLHGLTSRGHLHLVESHPDEHFGLEPLRDILSTGPYVGIVFSGMYIAIVLTEILLFGDIGAFARDLPAFIGFITFMTFLPIIVFSPSVPVAIYVIKKRSEFLTTLRYRIAHYGEPCDERDAKLYTTIRGTSPFLLRKRTVLGYSVSTIASLFPGLISALIKTGLRSL